MSSPSSNNNNNNNNNNNSNDTAKLTVDYDVVVVGGGCAGLCAAQHVSRIAQEKLGRKLNVLVLEAASDVGGRVKTLHNFTTPTPDGAARSVEIGAELIHGEDTSISKVIKEQGWSMSPVYTWAHGDGGPHPEHPVQGGIGLYYIGREKKMLRYDASDADFKHLSDTLWKIGDMDPEKYGANMSVLDYLRHEGVSPRMLAMAEAGYSNTLCSSLWRIPLKSAISIEKNWQKDGGNELRIKGSLQLLMRHLRSTLRIWTNWIVQRIVWRGVPITDYLNSDVFAKQFSTNAPYCEIFSNHGEKILAHKVIIAVPITVLQDEDIIFTPPLPAKKLAAAKRIVMEPCMKLIIKFSRAFWPNELHGVICADCAVPEFWVSDQSNPAVNEWILVGFACSEFARRLGSVPRFELQRVVTDQLDEMFCTPTNPNPARDSLVDFFVQDWTKEPFVRGGYSSPSPQTERGPVSDRSVVGQSVGDQLFFAGEATGDGFATLHSAYDSGIRAADDVVRSFAKELRAAASAEAAANATAATTTTTTHLQQLSSKL